MEKDGEPVPLGRPVYTGLWIYFTPVLGTPVDTLRRKVCRTVRHHVSQDGPALSLLGSDCSSSRDLTFLRHSFSLHPRPSLHRRLRCPERPGTFPETEGETHLPLRYLPNSSFHTGPKSKLSYCLSSPFPVHRPCDNLSVTLEVRFLLSPT